LNDSGHLELDWLLSCEIEELIASVRPMSAKNCERYARVILGRIGGPRFEQLLMRIVETMLPRDGRGPPTNSDEFILQSVTCSPMSPWKMMSWAGSYFLLCECANYGSKSILISTCIEHALFMQFAAIGSVPPGHSVTGFVPAIFGATAALPISAPPLFRFIGEACGIGRAHVGAAVAASDSHA
jgi:hypothetical protein